MHVYQKPTQHKQSTGAKTKTSIDVDESASETLTGGFRIYSEEEVRSSKMADLFGKLGVAGGVLAKFSYTAATCTKAASSHPWLLALGIVVAVVGFGLARYFAP